MADPIRAGMARGFQPLPANDGNRPVIRREPQGFRPGPIDPAGAGIRPAAGSPDASVRRMARPAAGAAVRAPEPPPIPQRLADLMRQEAGRANISAARPVDIANVATIPAAAGAATAGAVVTPASLAAPAATPVAQSPAAPVAAEAGTFQVEPQTADVAFAGPAEPAPTAPSAALANQVRQAVAAQDILAATAAPQPAQEGGIGMAKRPRVVIDQLV